MSPYVDYVAGISPADAQRIANDFADEQEASGRPPDSDFVAFRQALDEKDHVQWVLVEVYEWESSLGD